MGIAKIDGVEWPDIAKVFGVDRGFAHKVNGIKGTLVYDTFTDTDSVTIASHTPDMDNVGNGWVVSASNDWQIQGNEARFIFTAKADWSAATLDVSEADVITEMTYSSGASPILILNHSSTTNMWVCAWTLGIKIREITAGTVTERATNGSTGPSAGDRLIARTNGDTISFETRGSQSYSASYNVASRPNKSNTKHGIGADSNNAYDCDEFYISKF